MDYVKLATCYYRDPAILAANKATRGQAEILFLRALAHCGGDETEGFVAADALQFLGVRNAERVASVLLEYQLWLPAEGGWRFRKWDYWQSEHDALARRRKSDRERQSRKRAGQADSPPDADPPQPVTDEDDAETPSRDASRDGPRDGHVMSRRTRALTERREVLKDENRVTQVITKGALVDAREDRPPVADDDRGPPEESSEAVGLARHYAAQMPLIEDHSQTLVTIRTALGGGYEPAMVRAGLDHLVAEQRHCTPGQLLVAMQKARGNWHPANGPSPGRGKPGSPYLDDLRAVHGTDAVAEAVAAMCDAAEADNARAIPLRALPGGAA